MLKKPFTYDYKRARARPNPHLNPNMLPDTFLKAKQKPKSAWDYHRCREMDLLPVSRALSSKSRMTIWHSSNADWDEYQIVFIQTWIEINRKTSVEHHARSWIVAECNIEGRHILFVMELRRATNRLMVVMNIWAFPRNMIYISSFEWEFLDGQWLHWLVNNDLSRSATLERLLRMKNWNHHYSPRTACHWLRVRYSNTTMPEFLEIN